MPCRLHILSHLQGGHRHPESYNHRSQEPSNLHLHTSNWYHHRSQENTRYINQRNLDETTSRLFAQKVNSLGQNMRHTNSNSNFNALSSSMTDYIASQSQNHTLMPTSQTRRTSHKGYPWRRWRQLIWGMQSYKALRKVISSFDASWHYQTRKEIRQISKVHQCHSSTTTWIGHNGWYKDIFTNGMEHLYWQYI